MPAGKEIVMALSARILPTIPRAMGVRLLATAVLVSFAATITLAQTARPSGPVASPPEYLETPCAVIAGGKETHLEGNKDAVDFNDKLLNYQEWQDPSKPGVRQHRPGSVIVLPNANNDEIKEAIEKKLGKKNCVPIRLTPTPTTSRFCGAVLSASRPRWADILWAQSE